MHNEHQIVTLVYDAKQDMHKADSLIRSYIPFIRSETSKFTKRICTDQDDEYSIAMIAFHEAIRSYTKDRGAFLSYASLTIRSRLTDYARREARHSGHISIHEENSEDDIPLSEKLVDANDGHEQNANLEATKEEIAELAKVMAQFGVTFTDIAENSPKQNRTMEVCKQVIRYACDNRQLLDVLLETKKLPMAQLVNGTKAERKTLERHRKYILAMLLIQTNGYEIIRGHLRRSLAVKGGGQV